MLCQTKPPHVGLKRCILFHQFMLRVGLLQAAGRRALAVLSLPFGGRHERTRGALRSDSPWHPADADTRSRTPSVRVAPPHQANTSTTHTRGCTELGGEDHTQPTSSSVECVILFGS